MELTPHYKNAFNGLKYKLQLMKDNIYLGRPETRIVMLEKLNDVTTAAKPSRDVEFAMEVEENKRLVDELN